MKSNPSEKKEEGRCCEKCYEPPESELACNKRVCPCHNTKEEVRIGGAEFHALGQPTQDKVGEDCCEKCTCRQVNPAHSCCHKKGCSSCWITPTPPVDNKVEWEEMVDYIFWADFESSDGQTTRVRVCDQMYVDKVKNWIANKKLEWEREAYEEGQKNTSLYFREREKDTKQELIKKCEGMKKSDDTGDYQTNSENMAYNEALDDLINSLKE